jgi:protein-tyrosine phosphatase
MSVGWIDLEGAHNVRDLGGLRAGTARTRAGVLLRSDALHELTDADVRILVDEVGLAQVIDLRADHERRERGRGALAGTAVSFTELEVIGPDDLARRAATRAEAFAAGLPAAQIIGDGYAELLDLGAAAFTAAFTSIVAPAGTPALVHCAIGKDRTGVLVAVLLDAADVDRDEIVADYARSGARIAPIIARWRDGESGATLSEQLAAFTALSAPETMEQTLDHLHRRWGGGAAYLQANGAAPAGIARWRRILRDDQVPATT